MKKHPKVWYIKMIKYMGVYAMALFSKLFGTYSDRQIKKILPLVDKIDALSDKYSAMTDEELSSQTGALKSRLAGGETLDDILPDAFAAVREASHRILGMRPYRVQLIGGIVLHQGRIAEMRTGEGKTLMATLPAYLNALSGEGVHIVTVNDYLAKRDSEWMGKVYRFMGLSVGLVYAGQSSDEKRAAYAADITYGTDNEFGFDYLRDNMVAYKSQLVQRGHRFAIVDEVDSILIDEARTPLIISGRGEESSELYKKADTLVARMSCHRIKEQDRKHGDVEVDEHGNEIAITEDYIVDEKARSAVLTENGIAKAEKYFGVENLGDGENTELMHYIQNALQARGVMKNDVDYVVKDGAVLIVDAFTGRIMHGRRYSNGLHQAIEAKENVKIANENRTMATITLQNYFRMYGKLSGMTGTAATEETEFREIYSLDVVVIPTNKPMIRVDNNDRVFKTEKGKYTAMMRQIQECVSKGQPILIGTVSVEKSELLSAMLKKAGIKHNVLNAKYHEREAEIVAQAGRLGAVTIATNMAGRGTDIILGGNTEFMAKQKMREEGFDEEAIIQATNLGHLTDTRDIAARERFCELEKQMKVEQSAEAERVRQAGGLYILGTERHESRRIDNQLRGRSGRQGDPGESCFYISFQDDLLRLNGADRIPANLPIPEDEAMDMKLFSSVIESAQQRVEGRNFERRKTVLEYDDVVNSQRELIYKERREVLDDVDVTPKVRNMIDEYVTTAVANCCVGEVPDEWNFYMLHAALDTMFGTENEFVYDQKQLGRLTVEEVTEQALKKADEAYEKQKALFTPEQFAANNRNALLNSVDRHWMEHIDAMSDLQDSIGLTAYAGKKPIVEYKIEGGEMFENMIASIRVETVTRVMLMKPAAEVKRRVIVLPVGKGMNGVKSAPVEEVRSGVKKVGPNDPCPCGSGKKYKKCCGGVRGNG